MSYFREKNKLKLKIRKVHYPYIFSKINDIISRYQKSFHGVNLTSLHEEAMQEYFRQPVVDTFDIRICMSKSVKHSIDFATAKETDLHLIGKTRLFKICISIRFY